MGICRRPVSERWDASVLACHNSVLQPNPLRPGEIRVGVKCPVLIDPTPPPDPTTGGEVSDPFSRGVQRTRLMRQDFLDHGWTPGCKGCDTRRPGRNLPPEKLANRNEKQ